MKGTTHLGVAHGLIWAGKMLGQYNITRLANIKSDANMI